MHCHSRPNGNMTVKLDTTKACDRMGWCFLHRVMTKFVFKISGLTWLIMAIVELALFSFIINGKSSGFFRFMRGLWQGNSIYLYLFLFLIAKSLSSCYIGPFRDGVS